MENRCLRTYRQFFRKERSPDMTAAETGEASTEATYHPHWESHRILALCEFRHGESTATALEDDEPVPTARMLPRILHLSRSARPATNLRVAWIPNAMM